MLAASSTRGGYLHHAQGVIQLQSKQSKAHSDGEGLNAALSLIREVLALVEFACSVRPQGGITAGMSGGPLGLLSVQHGSWWWRWVVVV